MPKKNGAHTLLKSQENGLQLAKYYTWCIIPILVSSTKKKVCVGEPHALKREQGDEMDPGMRRRGRGEPHRSQSHIQRAPHYRLLRFRTLAASTTSAVRTPVSRVPVCWPAASHELCLPCSGV